jgi:AraC family transcriptional regulator
MKFATNSIKHTHRDATINVYHRAVARVVGHMNENLGEDHTLKEMADVAIISPFHFNRIFREVTGVSPVRYLYALRINEAKRLILTTKNKIIDICYSVGYNSLGSFNNRFVSLVGYSPRCIRSLAAHVDLADVRRELDVYVQRTKASSHDPCSLWGRVHVPPSFSGVCMVALFSGPPANAYPVAVVLAEGGAYALPPVRHSGTYFALAVGLTWHDQMVDFLLQPDCLQAELLKIHLSPNGRSSPIDFHLEPKLLVAPPAPPCLAFKLVDQFVRLPGNSAMG